uniref:G2E3 ligase n=1 Tax=Catharus ustulatus TaxID=91951 RepID=A0A8C3UP92_CATUS
NRDTPGTRHQPLLDPTWHSQKLRDHACGTLSLSPVCMLCHQTQADTDICGNMSVKAQLCVHTYCQVTSLAAPPKDTGHFLLEDTNCFICCKMGASITCCETSCPRTFHLPCAPDGECITQYFGTYRSFCWEHRPQQALHPLPSQDNTCSICLDTVEDRISYKTMGCPACQDTRFHRHCIQRLALHSGIAFRCPCCLNQELFMMEMLTMGIRLSKRLASPLPAHKESGTSSVPACQYLLCSSRPWQLWLCSSCAARGTHRHCPSLGNGKYTWECNTCAASPTTLLITPRLCKPYPLPLLPISPIH